MQKKAVVLLSGGLDSVTVLAMAQAQDYECFALSFDYGQRNKAELQAGEKIASDLAAALALNSTIESIAAKYSQEVKNAPDVNFNQPLRKKKNKRICIKFCRSFKDLNYILLKKFIKE